jgi:hypothetical protein
VYSQFEYVGWTNAYTILERLEEGAITGTGKAPYLVLISRLSIVKITSNDPPLLLIRLERAVVGTVSGRFKSNSRPSPEVLRSDGHCSPESVGGDREG